MKPIRSLAILSAFLVMLATHASAQDKPKSAEAEKPTTPLKIQVVFNEFDGEKKVGSLPYNFYVNAEERLGPYANVRMGVRVPVMVPTKEAPNAIQYMDVGTNIDCRARVDNGGRFEIDLRAEKSSLYTAGAEKKSTDASLGNAPLSSQPIIQQFKVSTNFWVRDGQTVQSTLATDPVSGHALKVEVTANVVK